MAQQELTIAPNGVNTHHFGDVVLSGMEQKERYENVGGHICIGGDMGDVRADSAWRGDPDEDGQPTVELVNAAFSSWTVMTRAEARDFLENTVRFAYDSIHSDAFLAG